MTFRSSFRLNKHKSSRVARKSRSFAPTLEFLEDRVTPAAGMVPGQGQVTGIVFRDMNANSVHDATEQGLAGRIVHDDANNNNQLDVNEIWTATDDQGVYTLNLAPGQHSIRRDFDPKRNEIGAAPTGGTQVVMVSAGVVEAGHDFGSLFQNPAIPLPQPTSPSPYVFSATEYYIQDLYRKILGRNAEPASLAYWVSRLTEGKTGVDEASRLTREAVAAQVWNSAEHRGLQVQNCYLTLLDRNSDAAGKAYWVAALQAGTSEVDVLHGFLTSPEYQANYANDAAFVTALYSDLLGRAPDEAGLTAWQQLLQAGTTRDGVVEGLLFSVESLTGLMQSYYAAFLYRSAEPEGMASWLAALQQRTQGLHQVGAGVLASSENFQAGQDFVLGTPQTAPIVVNSISPGVNQGGTVVTLRDAINLANKSPGPDTVVLQAGATYNLTDIDNYWYGPNGLPAISSEITIQGNGATINRAGDLKYRFFYVSNKQYGGLDTGSLTLQGLTLQGGLAQGGASYFGGGGLGAGGAIFNQGTLVLDSVLLTGNKAQGGATSSKPDGDKPTAGAGIGTRAAVDPDRPGGFGGLLPTAYKNFQDGGPTREGQGGDDKQPAGFGGGGGSANGGSGGFGGGGANNKGRSTFGGAFGGDGYYGGGGAGMGGALFNRGGSVTIVNSTMTNNEAAGGDASAYNLSGAASGMGGAVFNLNGSVSLTNATIAGNNIHDGSGKTFDDFTDGRQIYNLSFGLDEVGPTIARLQITNTILAQAGAPSGGYDLVNQVGVMGSRAIVENVPDLHGNAKTNIISTDIANLTAIFTPGGAGEVSDIFIKTDPKLLGLNNNQGWTRTMALAADSPARNAGAVMAIEHALYDQRGPSYPRTSEGMVDIGAIQMRHMTNLDRLAKWVWSDDDHQYPYGGQFQPVAAQSIGVENAHETNNVYVISHGWMPGYIDWVNQAFNEGRLPLSWETWQGPVKTEYPSTEWLFAAEDTDDFTYLGSDQGIVAISADGLAKQILAYDQNATILAYSWIDESATPALFDTIPTKGYHSESFTTMAGMQMAQAIGQALAPDYAEGLGKVHLIGHSHGARVATVAALQLQKAAEVHPELNVVRQLTLLDSPEDKKDLILGITDFLTNPVEIDAANFNWYYLSQINMPDRYSVTATYQGDGVFAISAENMTHLRNGMGVTGPGMPAGQTISSMNPHNTNDTIGLHLPVDINPGASIDLLFWNWSDNAIFVDSYASYFGTHYANFTVNGTRLDKVVDVILNTYPVFHIANIAGKHEYAANWYSGSEITQETGYQPVGFYWSPLLSGASAPPASSTQANPRTDGGQFQLTNVDPESVTKVVPVFTEVKFTEATPDNSNWMPAPPMGNVTVIGSSDEVTGLTLKDDHGPAVFTGYIPLTDDDWRTAGFAFDYTFSGPVSDKIQLQVKINGDLYFVMSSGVALASGPGTSHSTSHFTSTFGLAGSIGDGNDILSPQIQIRLVNATGQTGATTVTLNNFRRFTDLAES